MGSSAAVTVLLIEDDPDLLELGAIYLESEGHLVFTARDGAHALRFLDGVSPDVIITDMMMPVLDGFGFLREFGKRPSPRPPVIAYSGFEPYLEEAKKLGVAATLLKPIELPALAETVRKVLCGDATSDRRARDEQWAIEARRLQAVLDLDLDTSFPDQELEAFVRGVAGYFNVPIALISFITEDRQRWAAACGLPLELDEARETPRDQSFCTHAVAARAALIVQDAVNNPFFSDNVLVRERGVRFYAGVPLIARHGEALGTLCLIDYHPHRFTYYDLELLGLFARRVLAALERRERRRGSCVPTSAFRYLDWFDPELGAFGKEGFVEIAAVEAARAAEARRRVTCAVLAVPHRRLPQVLGALKERTEHAITGRLGYARIGWLVHGLSPSEACEAVRQLAGCHTFVEATELGDYPDAARSNIAALELALGDAGLA